MIKKILAGMLISSMVLFALPNNELELEMIAKAAQKKALVMTTMKLKGEEKENFGKLYDTYQLKLMKHRMDELTLISDYAKDYKNMTNENAKKIMIEWLTLEQVALELKNEYMLKFTKVISSADVIRYFQIENRLQLQMEMRKAKAIPLAVPKINQN